MKFDKPFIVIGAGGHAGVVVDLLLAHSADVLFLTDRNAERHGSNILDVPITGTDAQISDHTPNTVYLAMGLGISGRGRMLMANTQRRLDLACAFAGRGYDFPSLIHPTASVGRNVTLGDGVQIMAGAVIQPNCRVGKHTVINTGATVDHNSSLGAGVHVGPGATLCGQTVIGNAAYIGAGATVVNHRVLGDHVFVTAGAVVTTDAADSNRLSGNPAKADIQ
tara:strand:+ start:19694 stop:20359 length:666 start_codon:yes stop_codon:yes gene_type:complete